MKTAIGYIRVSTDEQKENGYSLDAQSRVVTDWARQNGYVLIKIISDDFTGKKLNRPGLDEVRRIIQSGSVSAIICYHPGRLSRVVKHRILLRDEFWAANVDIAYVTHGVVRRNSSGRFTDTVQAGFDEYEAELIAERTDNGRREKVAGGSPIGSGVPPFGYTKIGTRKSAHLVIDEEEAEVVRLIYALYIEHGYSVPSIRDYLNRNGIQAPGRPGGCRGLWSTAPIYKILKRSAYCGDYYQFVTRRTENGRVFTPPDEWGMVSIPAIISREVYDAAQLRMSQSKVRSGKTRTKHITLLTHRVRCRCGAAMTTVKAKAGRDRYNYYYVCSRKHNYPTACDQPNHNANTVNAYVIDWLIQIVSTPENIIEASRAVGDPTNLYEQLAAVVEQLNGLDDRRSMLIALYLDKRYKRETLDEQMERIESEAYKLQAQKDQLEADIQTIRTAITQDEAERIACAAATAIEYSDLTTMRAVVEALDVRAIINGDILDLRSKLGQTTYQMV